MCVCISKQRCRYTSIADRLHTWKTRRSLASTSIIHQVVAYIVGRAHVWRWWDEELAIRIKRWMKRRYLLGAKRKKKIALAICSCSYNGISASFFVLRWLFTYRTCRPRKFEPIASFGKTPKYFFRVGVIFFCISSFFVLYRWVLDSDHGCSRSASAIYFVSSSFCTVWRRSHKREVEQIKRRMK